jgi:hypothetical protein
MVVLILVSKGKMKQVEMVHKDLYEFLKLQLPQEMKEFVLLSDKYISKVRTFFLAVIIWRII